MITRTFAVTGRVLVLVTKDGTLVEAGTPVDTKFHGRCTYHSYNVQHMVLNENSVMIVLWTEDADLKWVEL